jgi:hypothetical protein
MGGIRTIKKSHHQRQEKAKLNNNQILVKWTKIAMIKLLIIKI